MRGRAMVAGAVLALAAGCGAMSGGLSSMPDRIQRPATNTPDQFVLSDGTLNKGAACRNPLIDPRDKASLELVRSDRGRGDYRVPEGSYGVGANELLRVDCTTGRTVGIVRGR